MPICLRAYGRLGISRQQRRRLSLREVACTSNDKNDLGPVCINARARVRAFAIVCVPVRACVCVRMRACARAGVQACGRAGMDRSTSDSMPIASSLASVSISIISLPPYEHLPTHALNIHTTYMQHMRKIYAPHMPHTCNIRAVHEQHMRKKYVIVHTP